MSVESTAEKKDSVTKPPGLIVHEWIEKVGGAEGVLKEMLVAFPESPVFCLWRDNPELFSGVEVRESILRHIPKSVRKILGIPLMLIVWRTLPRKYREAPWILASSHLFAHHAEFFSRKTLKFSYIHSPARYLWAREVDSRGAGFLPSLAGIVLRPIDRYAATKSDRIAANSKFIQDRILKSWGKSSVVIYPPVDVDFFSSQTDFEGTEAERALVDSLPNEFVLGASRLVSYKRLDVVIDFGRVNKVEVLIVGSGPELRRLKIQAQTQYQGHVRFLGNVSQNVLREIYRKATVLVFPGVEDFGIAPVEAMAAGTPVICNALGGASETVIDGVSGFVLESFDEKQLKLTYSKLSCLDPLNVKTSSARFSSDVFRQKLTAWISAS